MPKIGSHSASIWSPMSSEATSISARLPTRTFDIASKKGRHSGFSSFRTAIDRLQSSQIAGCGRLPDRPPANVDDRQFITAGEPLLLVPRQWRGGERVASADPYEILGVKRDASE